MRLPVSIIIPTLNEEQYLPRLLQAIERQTQLPKEVLVVDANSKDRTREIAKEFHCKIIPGGPLSIARNNGAAAAKEELMIFFDADVLIPKTFLEHTYQEFVDRNFDMASCYVTIKSRNPFDRAGTQIINTYYKLTENIKPHGFGSCIFSTKRAHHRIGGFDESILLGEDNDYILRAKKARLHVGLLRSEKIIFSLRRFEKEGRVKATSKYVLMELLALFSVGIKKDFIPFEFGKHEYHD